MNKPNQAWVSTHEDEATIFVNKGYEDQLTAFAKSQRHPLQLLRPDAFEIAGKFVTLEYSSDLPVDEAKALLAAWEKQRTDLR